MQTLLQQNLFAKVTCSGTRAYLGGFWVQTHLNESIPVITCPQIIVNPQIQIPQIFSGQVSGIVLWNIIFPGASITSVAQLIILSLAWQGLLGVALLRKIIFKGC